MKNHTWPTDYKLPMAIISLRSTHNGSLIGCVVIVSPCSNMHNTSWLPLSTNPLKSPTHSSHNMHSTHLSGGPILVFAPCSYVTFYHLNWSSPVPPPNDGFSLRCSINWHVYPIVKKHPLSVGMNIVAVMAFLSANLHARRHGTMKIKTCNKRVEGIKGKSLGIELITGTS